MTPTGTRLARVLTLALLTAACQGEPSGPADAGSETGGPGDEDPDPSSGSGEPDPSDSSTTDGTDESGDGDGDPGDGDGDPGDGDGDPGDGDGDGDPGDGDGDPGDGDGDPGVLPEGAAVLLHVTTREGDSIASASVTVDGVDYVTDGDGLIQFEALQGSRLLARVDVPGFVPASVAVDLAEDLSVDEQVELLPLAPAQPLDAGLGGEASDGSSPQDNSMVNAGAVYVFVSDGQGTWTQQAYVKAPNPDASDSFGSHLDLSDDGTSLAVGARFEDSNAQGIGGDQLDNSASNAGVGYLF